MNSLSCPSAELLGRVLVGAVPGEEGEALARHLESCTACACLAASLRVADPLLTEVQSAASVETPPSVHLDPLVERMRQLSSPAAQAAESEQALTLYLGPPQRAEERGRLSHYRLLEPLGTGGMGLVYLAEDTRLGRQVALKLLRPQLATEARARQRFLGEARAMASVHHDHVVTIHEVGGEDALPYFAMERLQGEPLDRWLEHRDQPSVAEIVRIGSEIALGLKAAHERGLIHRDIKPANLWIEAGSQRVKLLDFGLARPMQDPHLTEVGQIVGTPAFMSPEQAAGADVDPRSDLFGLGGVLYWLCTRQLPFPGPNALAILQALAVTTPRPVREVNPDVPPRLEKLIQRLLAKTAAQRPASAQAVVEELRHLDLAEKPRAARRLRMGIAAAAVLLVAAAIVIRIRTNDGREIEIPVPDGAKVEIVDKKPTEEKPLLAGAVPLDGLRRADIPLEELLALGDGDVRKAPEELVAILGDSRLQHWSDTGGVAFSPNGKFLASAGRDGVRLWDAGTFQLLRRVGRAASFETDRVAISPDNRWIACTTWQEGSGDLPRTAVLIADAATGAAGMVLRGHARGILCLAFSPNGQLVAAGSDDGAVKVWDARSGQERLSHREPPGQGKRMLTSLAFSRDGKRLATGASGGVVRVHDLDTGKEICRLDHPPWCDSVVFSRDGKALLSSSGDKLRVWDATEWKELPALELPRDSKGNLLAFRPDGQLLVASGKDEGNRGYLRFWSWPAGKMLRTIHPGSLGSTATGLSFAPDGNTLAVSSVSGAITLRNPETGLERPTRTRPGHAGALKGLALTRDGRTLVSGGLDGKVRLWDLTVSPPQAGRVLEPFAAQMDSLALSPNGKLLATAGVGTTSLWAMPEGRQLGTVATLRSVHLVREGAELIGARGSDVVRIDTTDRQILKTWPVTPAHPGQMIVSDDGHLVATLDRTSHVVKVWDAQTGQEQGTLPVIGGFQTMRFSPDGKRLGLGANFDWRLWDVDQRKEVFRTRINDFVYGVAFRPDGKQIATLTFSGVVQLWDGTGATPLRTIRLGATGHTPWQMLFSPEGRHLIVGNPNGTLYVLRLSAAK